tara:strand:- start:7016 stop:7984 length:969 start_codon:yes stop_codon:yes gene_type:complete
MPSKTLHFPNARHLCQLYANNDQNLTRTEERLNVNLATREDWLEVEGDEHNIEKVEDLFETLELGRNQGLSIRDSDFKHILTAVAESRKDEIFEIFSKPITLKIKDRSVIPKTIGQKRYVQFIQKHDIVFGVGPAGTGKTYLAMAAALQALFENKVSKILLTRPAVEAGEALGFLPGDLQEKILPYLRPIYDAMYDIIGKDDADRLIEKGLVEIAPLAYMRGRTLSNAFIILDEAQNTSREQMLMFLTRLGDDSRMVITGDITQVDLPHAKQSGLKQAVQVLNKVQGIKLFYFETKDIVRHPLVQDIIEAYDHFFAENNRFA